jgi:hypothetical protein
MRVCTQEGRRVAPGDPCCARQPRRPRVPPRAHLAFGASCDRLLGLVSWTDLGTSLRRHGHWQQAGASCAAPCPSWPTHVAARCVGFSQVRPDPGILHQALLIEPTHCQAEGNRIHPVTPDPQAHSFSPSAAAPAVVVEDVCLANHIYSVTGALHACSSEPQPRVSRSTWVRLVNEVKLAATLPANVRAACLCQRATTAAARTSAGRPGGPCARSGAAPARETPDCRGRLCPAPPASRHSFCGTTVDMAVHNQP